MENIVGQSILDQFFDETTMSVHFKENTTIIRKKGKPGDRKIEVVGEKVSKEFIENIIDQLYKELESRNDAFLEIDRKLSKVLQIGPYRTVIVLAPLSDGLEITVVKPTKKLSIDDYQLSAEMLTFFNDKAKGVLVCGAPGEGKTTFAQALVDLHLKQNKVIKTIESPRDLMVPDSVVQYSFSYGTHSEIRDILLLSRPDVSVYDEVRNQEDFDLFKDLRLTGIGLIGVIHATSPVDSIQRFIGTIELGMIPQVIDTIVFIKGGQIEQIFELDHVVKVPSGMMSEDLARPVILVKEFTEKKVMYEIYSFGEQVVVMPIDKIEGGHNKNAGGSMMHNFAKEKLTEYLEGLFDFPFFVEMSGINSFTIFVPSRFKGRVIGKSGAYINDLEKKLGSSINVKTLDEMKSKIIKVEIDYEGKGKKQKAILTLPREYAGKNIPVAVGDELFSIAVDRQGECIIKNRSLINIIEEKGGIPTIEQ